MKKGTLFKTIVTLIPFLILIVFFGTNNVFAIKDEYNIQINSSKGIIAEKELVAEAGDIVNCAVQLETDYSLYTMNVIDGQGNSIDYTYDNNIITFQMPKSDINVELVAVKQLIDGVYMSVFTNQDFVYGYDTFEMGSIAFINTLTEPIELVSTGFSSNNIYDYNSELFQNYIIMPASRTQLDFNLKKGLQAGEYSDVFQFVIKHKDEVSGADLVQQFAENIDVAVNKVIVTELPKVTLSTIKEGQSLKDVELTYEAIPYGNLMWEDENATPSAGTVISPIIVNIEDTINYDFSLLNEYFISDNQMRFYVNVEVLKDETTTQETSTSEQISTKEEVSTTKNDDTTKSVESTIAKETQSTTENTTTAVESTTAKETQSTTDNKARAVESTTAKETQSTTENTTTTVESTTTKVTQTVTENTTTVVESTTAKETENVENTETTNAEDIIDEEQEKVEETKVAEPQKASTQSVKSKDIMVSVPTKVSIVVDPYKINGDTNIYSNYVSFENSSEDEVDINIINFKVNVKKQSATDEPPCVLYLVDNNGNKYKLNNGDNPNVYIMELGGVNSNNNISGFYIQGDITEGNIEGWSEGDITVSILYKVY